MRRYAERFQPIRQASCATREKSLLYWTDVRSLPRLRLSSARRAPADALAFPKYMTWDQSGTDSDVWTGMLAQKLGLETVEELSPLDRP
jgi:hypothetical protein